MELHRQIWRCVTGGAITLVLTAFALHWRLTGVLGLVTFGTLVTLLVLAGRSEAWTTLRRAVTTSIWVGTGAASLALLSSFGTGVALVALTLVAASSPLAVRIWSRASMVGLRPAVVTELARRTRARQP
ncbi:MAG: hypothetical protein JOZ82_10445 [Marmoricola sp.]|nr:hypothetical protein [Marmoricola sp.]